MARQNIFTGTVANDGTGDTLRQAFTKVNANFVELYDLPAGSPGGSSGQLQFNDAGAFGGMAGTSWDNTTRSLTITGATVTASSPVLNLSQTWNDAAVTFTGLLFNATNTASAAASLLMDLQTGGGSRFNVSSNGSFSSGQGLVRFTYDAVLAKLVLTRGTSVNPSFEISNGSDYQFRMSSASTINWTSGGANLSADLSLFRDGAADTLAQRRGTNAQTSRIYNTYTDASNYERGFTRWNSNILEIGTESAGSGTPNRRVDILSQGVTYQFINIGLSLIGGSSVYHQIRSSAGPIVGLGGGNGPPGFGFVGTVGNGPFQVRTNNVNRLVFDTVGSMELAVALTVATLPGTPVVGMMARVTDADSPAVGSTVVGGGAANALVWYNGTNWTVIGV
jgi:hypothetical protein